MGHVISGPPSEGGHVGAKGEPTCHGGGARRGEVGAEGEPMPPSDGGHVGAKGEPTCQGNLDQGGGGGGPEVSGLPAGSGTQAPPVDP